MAELGQRMILEILFIVVMALWFLTSLPVSPAMQYGWASSWLAFLAVLLLGLYLFMPALRG
jgi:hypothetical protein